MAGTELPLAGVRVIEMTHMVMGPTCGMILAQLGAEVIKVEPPAGDKTRSLGGMGTSMIGPTIIIHGNEEQKKEHLGAILRGEVQWCQGYSEPGSGSDLASLQTRAIRDGDDNFATHDLSLVMRIGVIFARPIVMIPLRRRIKRRQLLKPFVVIAV